MGARTQWEIVGDDGSSTYLYSHWGGDSKWSDTASALEAARPRWQDVTYATRIFISQIIGTQWGEETGFGIIAAPSGQEVFEESYFPTVINFSAGTIEADGKIYSFDTFLMTEDVLT